MRTVSTRSHTIENTTANEKNSKHKAGDANKSRNPFSDISNQVMERFSSRPIAIKQSKQQSHPLANPTNHVDQSKDLMAILDSNSTKQLEQQIEEIEIDSDERKTKRRISSRVINLRNTKRSKKTEEVIQEEIICIEIEESPQKSIVNWIDIDAEDYNDPAMVSEYVNDIYTYLFQVEKTTRVNPKYMTNQLHVTEKMRAILVDWTVEVHSMFKLMPETLFLSWAIIDHYLEVKVCSKEILQLLGVTSMLIASKFEEIYAPVVTDFVFITDNAYTRDDILDMEEDVLATLNFSLNYVSPLHFLRRISKAAESDYTIHTLCKYIIEICAIDIRLLKYLPSEIAVGATYLARAMMHQFPIWTPTLEHYSTYNENHAREVAIEINKLLKRIQKSNLKNIQTKYSQQKYGEVSTKYTLINDL